MFFLVAIVVASSSAAGQRENVEMYTGHRIRVEGREILLVRYEFAHGTYEVTLEVDGTEYVLTEGEMLDLGYTITFLGKKEPPKLSFAFYISALPQFDELKEVVLYEGQTAQIRAHPITVEQVDTDTSSALIFFGGEESFLLRYGGLESEDLHLWLFRAVIGLSNPYVVLKCRFFYRDTEGILFPEEILRVPATDEPRCVVVVGAAAADQDHITAAALAEALQCEVFSDRGIGEDQRRIYTLILVGGPLPPCGKSEPANTITREIVEKGLVQESYWTTGNGAREGFRYVEDPWGYGNDVLIVAGSDRENTSLSGQYFIEIID